ncbi:hypothetical protein L7F22_041975 [Adiantum nelumboides]|nr:hypothetical protein [Adiantum nelumboides]
MVEAPKEEVHCKGSPLSYAWGKVREHDAFILFDPGSTHNFISLELATKLGVQDFEMGDAMKADGTFINQEVSVTPLIGKLRLHIQRYVDKEDFFISPLKHEDVILGAPWFDHLAASIKFPERKISFKFREKDMYINAQESGSSIPLVNDQAFDKSIKSSVSTYMIFVKDSLNGVDETQVNENGMQVDLELSNFLNQFQDVFIDDIPRELPPKRGDDDHMIELIPGSSPPNKPPYRVSQAQQEEIMRQVNELVEKGMVRPSSSPFCSPVLLVQKKDGTYRMCVNYRALNRITIKNRFPVPRVEDLFDKLQGSTYFSRIDLKSGYHQIRIVDEDIVKTAFCTMFGLYEYLVMPFGLTNAPATFNRMMERIFRPHCNFTRVFFDNVIIYSKTIEEHKEHLKVIFQALRDNKLYVNQKKSEFFLQEIQYLGHIISKNGIRMDPAKLEVIKDWPNPRNLHEVRSFIGMCAYYRRFIEKFSLIAGPLHDLTKKNVKYVWTEKRQQAFDTLKQKLISQPVLALSDLSKPFEVQCDACGDCLGAVLLREGHAIAYESGRLSSDEQILGIYEKERLAVLHALDSWKHYLLGTPFSLRTDHQSLKYFMTQTKLSDKQMRWENFLSRFNFHIAHIAGKHNQVADALSRRLKVNAVSIATHNDLSSMIDEYAIDPNFKHLGTRLNFSLAYHPQTDGQSEIANLTVLDLLKAYVAEVDQRSQWEKYLPLVEYAYNNTVHTSIGKAPFEVIEGRPKSPLLLKVPGKIFTADEYSRDLKESFQKIKEAISIAQQKQKATANKHRRALAFKENDWVLLKFPKARLRHTTGKNPTGHQKYYAKLEKRYYGPFQILKPINEMAYQLKFPKHWLIHNAFHVSLLKPYKGEPPKEAIMEDPPELEGQEEVLQPESVLRHEDKVLRNGKIIRWYLIKFKNYPFEDAKWMQGTRLKDSLHLVNAYNDSLDSVSQAPSGLIIHSGMMS